MVVLGVQILENHIKSTIELISQSNQSFPIWALSKTVFFKSTKNEFSLKKG